MKTKQDFNTAVNCIGRLFLPESLKNVLHSLNELFWSIFERSLEGFADFAGSNSNGRPTGPVSIEKTTLVWELYETGGLFRAVCSVSIKKSKLGQLAIRWNFAPATSIGQSPTIVDSSRKLTTVNNRLSMLRYRGTFFDVPWIKEPGKVLENSCFAFRFLHN